MGSSVLKVEADSYFYLQYLHYELLTLPHLVGVLVDKGTLPSPDQLGRGVTAFDPFPKSSKLVKV